MESKKTERKLNSWFWFILTSMPIIFILIYYILAMPKLANEFFKTNVNFYNFIQTSLNTSNFQNIVAIFNQFAIPSISSTFDNLFRNVFFVNNPTSITYIFSYMLSIQVYHLIYDVLKFIIEWCHELIEKAYK